MRVASEEKTRKSGKEIRAGELCILSWRILILMENGSFYAADGFFQSKIIIINTK